MDLLLFLAFLLGWAFALAAISMPNPDSLALVRRQPPPTQHPQATPISSNTRSLTASPPLEVSKDHDLLDIVLVASVDGKFHAINRTSGYELWSMSSFLTTTSVSAPSTLAPLVRTSHPPGHFDADEQQETYIIEPQSGAIYVLHSPSTPLQRFPFTMSELVDISPFTSVNGDETRVFVGRKETSLLLIELETGKIKATLNSECPPIIEWEGEDDKIDLDELEEDRPQVSAPTEVYIGRTDYHISIYKAQRGMPTVPFQNLTFSTYGPNNKDNHLQAAYRRTNDDSYIQSMPNGELISFRTKPTEARSDGKLHWALQFSSPIVAIFDVLQPHHSPHAFVLLQPRPRLQDLFPSLQAPTRGSAYVGLVEESSSLFAMSTEQYPLVVFSGSERKGLIDKGDGKTSKKGKEGKTLDPPMYDPDGQADDRPAGRLPELDEDDSELDRCLINPYDLRCLVGVRQVDQDDGYEGRTKRLLDGPKTQVPGVQQTVNSETPVPVVIEVGRSGWEDSNSDNANGTPSVPHGRLGLPDGRSSKLSWAGLNWIGLPGSGEAVLVSLLFGLVSIWLLWKRVKGKIEEKIREAAIREDVKEVGVENGSANAATGKREVVDEVGELLERSVPKGIVRKDAPPSLDLQDNMSALNSGALSTPTAIPAPDTPSLNTAGLDEGDDTEGEGEGGPAATPGKRRVRRGKRGKKKKPGVAATSGDGDEKEVDKEEEKKPSSLILTSSSPKPPVIQQPSLTVSDTILGFGSHGTVVYQGSLQGRAVAVKRLLQDFVTLAAREVSILQESDDHPNVIRYYYQESHANFLYIALELCPASLADIIESPDRDAWRDIAINFDPKKALKQIASGLRHLHALKLIHRDIKPQNILISSAKGAGPNTFGAKNGKGGAYRMLISDFGLCKKLDIDQTSFLPTAHGALAAGTVGWRAPEILRGEVKLDEFSSDDASLSSRGSVATVHGGSSSGSTGGGANGSSRPLTRLTKSVDIFALGCLFYYTLTNGGHPYGDRFEREVNIMKDQKDLGGLERFGEEGTEAKDLITAMLHPEAKERPDTTTVLLHPFFWDAGRRLNFLQDASDRFEIMCRDPKDQHLITLERGAINVVGNDWHARLDKTFIENLGKYRKYDGRSVQDLMRALRNKKHHYQDLPDNVKRHLGPMPEGFLAYFTRRYPQLFLHVHGVIKDTGLHSESMFRSYFELPDH